MPDADDRPGADGARGGLRLLLPLAWLWVLLPVCVWWISFGAGSLGISRTAAIWSPPLLAITVWGISELLFLGSRRRRGPDPAPQGVTELRGRTAVGGAAYLLVGAGFLTLLGPGIAPAGERFVRALVGALLIGLAWTGWSALHPVTRRLALHLLRSIRGFR